MYKMLREGGAVTPIDGFGDGPMVLVATAETVKEVFAHPEIYSSGLDAVDIGQIRPLIPLQIDPPRHKYFRRLLDPILGRQTVADLEPQTRELVKELIAAVKDDGTCNFHHAFAEPLPSTVFLQLLGLPVSRTKEFVALKDGIIRPPGVKTHDDRVAAVHKTGQEIYAILRETIDARAAEPQNDMISMFLDAEVDGEKLTHDQMEDILYLFFLAGLDTVTASLDCMISFLAQHPDHRQHARRRPVADSARGRGDAAVGDAGARRHPDHSGGHRTRGLPDQKGHERVGDDRFVEHRRGACGSAPTKSTSTATPRATSRSAAATIAASARTWRAWNCASRSKSGWRRCRTSRSKKASS